MDWAEYLEGKETVVSDGVEYPKGWFDERGEINAEMFNSMVKETGSHLTRDESADDSLDDDSLGNDSEDYASQDETLPEMEIIELNVYIV